MSFLINDDGYTQVYCIVGFNYGQSNAVSHGIYYGPDNANNDFSICFKRDTNDAIAAIHAATFAIEQAAKLNIQKLRVFTDCEHLFDTVNANIAIWKSNGWLSLDDGQPLLNRSNYEELDRVMESVPMDIEFELLDADSENQHLNEAYRLLQHIDTDNISRLAYEELRYEQIAFMRNVIQDAISYTDADNRTIITEMDVINALQHRDLFL